MGKSPSYFYKILLLFLVTVFVTSLVLTLFSYEQFSKSLHIFAKHIGSVSAAASENLSLPFYPSDCTVQRGTETGSE